MNRLLNHQEVVALYTVNKGAKKCRDIRKEIKEELKKRLFDPYNNDVGHLSEEAWDYLKSKGFSSLDLPFSNRGLPFTSIIAVDKEEEKEWETVRECLFWSFDEMEDDDVYDSSGYNRIYSIYCIDDLIRYEKEKLPEEVRAGLPDLIEEEKRLKVYYKEARETIDKMHEFLHHGTDDLTDKSRNLYDLKDAVIKASGIAPSRYDEDEYAENYYLALYEIGGFKFHSRVLMSDVDDSKLPDDMITISEISSDNRLSQEDKITLEEAVNTLSKYLGLESGYADKILSGESIDLRERFQLTPSNKFEHYNPEREYRYNRYNRRNGYRGHRYDYDDYDDYNDYNGFDEDDF